MNILWHVSYDKIDKFALRIPRYTIEGENKTTPRISLCDSFQNCFTAMPGSGYSLKGLLKLKKEMPKLIASVHAYNCIMNDDDPYFVPPERVIQFGVLDAVSTGEFWALKVPEFKHIEIEIFGAEFYDYIDSLGNNGMIVKSLDYDISYKRGMTIIEYLKSKKCDEVTDIRRILVEIGKGGII